MAAAIPATKIRRAAIRSVFGSISRFSIPGSSAVSRHAPQPVGLITAACSHQQREEAAPSGGGRLDWSQPITFGVEVSSLEVTQASLSFDARLLETSVHFHGNSCRTAPCRKMRGRSRSRTTPRPTGRFWSWNDCPTSHLKTMTRPATNSCRATPDRRSSRSIPSRWCASTRRDRSGGR